MPIEFRCAGCQRLLRVADAMAGRQARCPSCGQIQLIPSPTAAAPDTPGASGMPGMPGAPGESGYPGAPSFGAPAGAGGPTYPPAGVPPPGPSPFGPPPAGPPPSAYPPTRQDFGPVNPYQTPSADTSMPSPFAAGSGAIVPTQLEISRALSAGWMIYKNELGTCLGLVLIAGIVTIAFSMILSFAMMATFGAAQMGGNPWMRGAQPQVGAAASFAIQLLSQFVQVLFTAWIMAGLNLCLLRLARGQAVNFGELFAGGRYWPRIVVGQILLWIIQSVVNGIVLFAVGLGFVAGVGFRNPESIAIGLGIGVLAIAVVLWVNIRLGMFSLAILDRDVGVSDSFGTVFRITQGNVLPCIGLFLIIGIPGVLLGILTCFIGFLFVGPFWALMYVVAYLHMSGQITKGDEGWMPVGGYGPTAGGYPAAGSGYPSPPPNAPVG